MNAKSWSAVLATVAAFASALPVQAQYRASGLSVFDSLGQEVGPVVSVLPPDPVLSIGAVVFSASIAGQSVVGTASASQLRFPQPPPPRISAVFYLNTNCTGQPYLDVDVGQATLPRLLEYAVVGNPSKQVWSGSLTAVAIEVPTSAVASIRTEASDCENGTLPGSFFLYLIPATLAGTFPAFAPPYRIGPTPALASSTTASVAAVAPGALAVLAGLLALTAIPFLARRSRS
jgi:hypothetical protein